jgi:phosphonate transport system substrate-binding protein
VTIFGLPSPGDVPTAELLEDLASLLESETGFTVNSFVAANAGSAVCALAAGQADAGFLPADAYAIAHDRYGVQVKLVVIQFGYPNFRGQFMVRTDSGISDLSELAGMNFAFADPGSISGYILPTIYIQNTQGKDPSDFFAETVFAQGHFGVGEAVYEGFFEETTIQGGAAFEDVRTFLEDKYPDIFSQVEVIAYTDYYPNSTVSMAPYLNDDVEQELTDAFLAVGASSEGQAILQELYGIEGLQITDDSAYDIAREVNAFTGYDLEPCDKAYLPTVLYSQ